MSKRNDPVARARGRKPAPVKKPFPLGFVLGAATLAAALIGILVYAVQNEGVGDKSSLKYAESAVDGLQITKNLKQTHVTTAVEYPNQKDTPPVGGPHNGTPQSCQVYTAPIASENAVHSMEHGAAWVTYDPDKVKGDDLKSLKEQVDGDPYRILSPYPGLKSAVSLQAWGEQLFVDSVKDKRIEEFLKLFTNGPQAKERGGQCQGTTASGPVQTAPAPAPSPTPSPTK